MKLIPSGIVLFITCSAAIFAQAQYKPEIDITGTWRHNTFYYVFGGTGIMSEVQVDSEPVMYNAYYYESVPDTSPALVRYGKDLADSASCSYLLVTDAGDSTVTIAYGTPFAREGEGEGLRGTWIHADDLSIITWTFGTDTVSYTEQILDLSEGVFVTGEQHSGTFTRGTRDESGRFFLAFDDGSIATIYPLIADNVMYLFDLTGRRSKFVRAAEAPAYAEYRNIRTQAGVNGNITR